MKRTATLDAYFRPSKPNVSVQQPSNDVDVSFDASEFSACVEPARCDAAEQHRQPWTCRVFTSIYTTSQRCRQDTEAKPLLEQSLDTHWSEIGAALQRRGWERPALYQAPMTISRSGRVLAMAAHPHEDALLWSQGGEVVLTSVRQLSLPAGEGAARRGQVCAAPAAGPAHSVLWLTGNEYATCDAETLRIRDAASLATTWKVRLSEDSAARRQAATCLHGRDNVLVAGVRHGAPLLLDRRQRPRRGLPLDDGRAELRWVHVCEDERTLLGVDRDQAVCAWDLRARSTVQQFNGSAISRCPPLGQASIPELLAAVPGAAGQLGGSALDSQRVQLEVRGGSGPGYFVGVPANRHCMRQTALEAG